MTDRLIFLLCQPALSGVMYPIGIQCFVFFFLCQLCVSYCKGILILVSLHRR